jgi:hypothetical protein
MAGRAKDTKKRAVLKKLLKTVKGRDLSDRDVAAACGCSRALVKAVRSELIGSGLHPPVTSVKGTGERSIYKAGAAARGGYVYDESGQIVREVIYAGRKAAKGKGRAGV